MITVFGHCAKIRRYPRTRLWVLLLLLNPLWGWAQYTLHIHSVDKDSLFLRTKLGLTTSFKTREACSEYVFDLIPLLQGKGYFTASVDSINYGAASASIHLYLGRTWRWASIDTRNIDPTLLAAAAWSP